MRITFGLVFAAIAMGVLCQADPILLNDDSQIQNGPLVLIGRLGPNDTRNQLVRQITTIYHNKGLKSYLKDCKSEGTLCNGDTDSVVIVSHGREIKYVGEFRMEDISEWIDTVKDRRIKQVNSRQQLLQIIENNGYAFVYFPSANIKEEQTYSTLAMKYLTTTFLAIKDSSLREQLGMKAGNITMYKNKDLQKQQFPNANSWQGWQSFVATYSFPGINFIDSNYVTSERFRDQANIRFVGLIVDHSLAAQKSIQQFYSYSKDNQTQLQLRLYLDYLRETQLVKIYYHLRPKRFPSLVSVSLVNRILKVSMGQGPFTTQDLQNFIGKAEKFQLQPFYLSQLEPENQGFTGKGAEKTIQKVVYSNFDSTVLKSRPTYVVMFTSIGNGCGNCQESYKQFKKLKSYLQEEDIVFARLEIVNNYIPEPLLSGVPQVVIYKQGKKEQPITERWLSRFDDILRLIRTHVTLSNSEL